MTIYRPELTNLGPMPDLELSRTHQNHMASESSDFLSQGSKIIETGKKIGAEATIRSGTFMESMLGALDKVSSYQQFASNMNQALFLDPDSVDPHDVTIAQAEASMALNITRNVLSRLIQSWRDVINTR
jgi:flagellar hook-basal body complex protein FliE